MRGLWPGPYEHDTCPEGGRVMLTFRVDFNGIQNDDELTTFLSDVRDGYFTSDLVGDVVQLRDGELSCRAIVVGLDNGVVRTRLDWRTWTTRRAERAERDRKVRRVFSAPVGSRPILPGRQSNPAQDAALLPAQGAASLS